MTLVLSLAVPAQVGAQQTDSASQDDPVDIQSGISAFETGEFDAAAGIFGTLAEGGNGEAMFYLGRMLEIGAGLPQPNMAAALAQYEAASQAGELKARNRLGLLYVSGIGVLQDFGKAHEFLKAAAEAGLADAQYNYGALFQNGLGVAKDVQTAYGWYEKAAAQGHLAANAILGEAYYNATDVLADFAKSYKYHRAAADQGAALSLYRVGQFYRDGGVVKKDLLQAHMYLNLAAARGVNDAVRERDALNAELGFDDVLKAQALARNWKAGGKTSKTKKDAK